MCGTYKVAQYVCELDEINVSTKLSLTMMSPENKRIRYFLHVSYGRYVAKFRNYWFTRRTESRGCKPWHLPLKSCSGGIKLSDYQIGI